MGSFSKRSFPLLPLLASLALVAGIGWAVYKLSGEISPDLDAAAKVKTLEQGNAELDKQRLALQKLLEAAPCEIAKKLGLTPKVSTASTPSVSPVTSAPTPTPASPPQTSSGKAQPPPVSSVTPSAAVVASLLDRVEDATVMVINIQSNGDLRLGTGFFVAPGMVVTNEHVAGGKSSKFLLSNAFLEGVAPAELVAVDKKKGRDYALLRVRTAKALRIPPLALRLDARRAEKVSAWGYPSAVSKNDPKYQALLEGNTKAVPDIIYSEGVISAVLDRKPPLIAHTTPLSPGNSGGPLVDAHGAVLGINTLISLDDESYRQTSLSLAASDLEKFLREAGVQSRRAEPAEGVNP